MEQNRWKYIKLILWGHTFFIESYYFCLGPVGSKESIISRLAALGYNRNGKPIQN